MFFKSATIMIVMKIKNLSYIGFIVVNVNQFMRSYNGNGKSRTFSIISQNIPCCFGTSEVETKLHELVSHYNPTIMCISEVRKSLLQNIALPDYIFVEGKQINCDDCRNNLFVKMYRLIEVTSNVVT